MKNKIITMNSSSYNLNPTTQVFTPETSLIEQKKYLIEETLEKIISEKIMFDNLEQDYIKNNRWLFLE